ncbi:MAG: 50S ribosomal protein L9 [bacterium]|nr:50S ribosomal protein L9 [bacterium]
MQVLLTQDVTSLGNIGDIKEVHNGYARNFLIPRKMAVMATATNIQGAKSIKDKIQRTEDKKKKDLLLLAEKLNATSITIRRQAGENDKLFGSVTNIDIASALAAEGLPINKKDILLKDPIKSLGIYTISIRLTSEINSQLKVWVIKE